MLAPHALLLDVAGPAEAMRLANLHAPAHGQVPRFRLRFVAPAPLLRSSVGLTLAELEPLPARLAPSSWVVLVGQPAAQLRRSAPAQDALTAWLGTVVAQALHAASGGCRLVTICSGALLAARAGLLDGRRCTTHHELLGALRALAPRAQVEDNRVFVIDGPAASSAGITAGIDLALHLIAQECGEPLAASVAQDMVVYLRRSPQDPELSPYLAHRRHQHAAVHRVQAALAAEPQRRWTMGELARIGHVTERHLLRLFMQHAGASPLHCLRMARLEYARQALARGASVAQAAQAAGFGSALHLRRAWAKQWDGTPSAALGVAVDGDPRALRA